MHRRNQTVEKTSIRRTKPLTGALGHAATEIEVLRSCPVTTGVELNRSARELGRTLLECLTRGVSVDERRCGYCGIFAACCLTPGRACVAGSLTRRFACRPRQITRYLPRASCSRCSGSGQRAGPEMPIVREPDGAPVTASTSVMAGTVLRSRSSGSSRRPRQ